MSGPDEMHDHEPPRASTVDEWIGRKPDNEGDNELERLRAVEAAVRRLSLNPFAVISRESWQGGGWTPDDVADRYMYALRDALETEATA